MVCVSCMKDGDISMHEFADSIFAGVSESGLIWNHFLGWWKHKDDENVLWVFFEDLKEDLRGEVERIAKFMQIAYTEELIDLVTKQSSFDFMSAPENNHHFDDHFVFEKVKVRMGLSPDAEFTVGKRARWSVVGDRWSVIGGQ